MVIWVYSSDNFDIGNMDLYCMHEFDDNLFTLSFKVLYIVYFALIYLIILYINEFVIQVMILVVLSCHFYYYYYYFHILIILILMYIHVNVNLEYLVQMVVLIEQQLASMNF